jgi:capsular exopolysaccharide synthesis family protein
VEPIHYLRALRRRWWVIVASVVVASVAAWVVTAAFESPEVAAARPTTYSATTTLWNVEAPTIGAPVAIPNAAYLANLVTLPEVASIAAQANPVVQSSQVYATTDPQVGRLVITGTASSPEQAVTVSTAYTHALITYLERLKEKRITAQQRVIERQIQNLQRQGSHPDLVASLRSALRQFAIDRTTPIPLQIFQAPRAVRDTAPKAVPASSGIQVPKSLPLRIALAALFGLLAGVVLALVLERFDTRIRSPRAAEEAFGLPVLAEVPAISRGRRGTIVTASHPSSRAADAFRLVGVGTSRWIADENGHGNGNGNGRASRAKTFLVTSPEARDGKTTVAANLAVAHAQAGSRVLVVSCDLRRPAIHEAFGVAGSPGLADALERTNGHADPAAELDLASYLEPCSVVRVAVVPSGVATEHPGALLGSATMQGFMERLKKITDVIILDCAPLVVASDVVPLLPQADGVIVVARARKTRRELAASTAALLERLGTTTAGVVLNDAREFSIPLAKRRMYRPPKKMRKSAKRSAPPLTEKASTLDAFVETESLDEDPPVQIPPREERPEQPRRRTLEPLQSLQDELVELRAQLEGLQLELPDIAASGLDRSSADPGDRE